MTEVTGAAADKIGAGSDGSRGWLRWVAGATVLVFAVSSGAGVWWFQRDGLHP